MSINKLLKQAEKAKTIQKRAEDEAKTSAEETETYLEQALLLVRSVQDATDIMRLSSSKETCLLAWKKAVILLGVTAKSLPDYILIAKRYISTTNKEWDIECERNKKKELILADCSVDDLDTLYAAFPDSYRQELRQRLVELAELCETRDDLDQLCEKYRKLKVETTSVINKHINRVSWK